MHHKGCWDRRYLKPTMKKTGNNTPGSWRDLPMGTQGYTCIQALIFVTPLFAKVIEKVKIVQKCTKVGPEPS